jgi:hypothetical protein
VSTGTAGSEASVSNSGTSENAVFDFNIPRGETGPQGPELPFGSEILYPSARDFPSGWYDTKERLLSGINERAVLTNDAFLFAGFSAETGANFEYEVYRANGLTTTFDSLFTSFDPGDLSTMVDSDGKFKWRPHNYLPTPDNWDNLNNTTVTSGQTDPDGGTDAWLVTHGATSSESSAFVSCVDGVDYTFETIIKADNGAQWLRAYCAGVGIWFDVTNSYAIGTTETGFVSFEANSLGSDWYHIKLVCTSQADGNRVFGVQAQNGDGVVSEDTTADMYFYEPRAYRSDLAGMVNNPETGDSYVPTTTAAVFMRRSGHHIWDSTLSKYVNSGILYEPTAATNLVTYSRPRSSDWSETSGTIGASRRAMLDTTDPKFGAVTRLVESNDSDLQRSFRSGFSGLTLNQKYFYSAKVKPNGRGVVIRTTAVDGILIDQNGSLTIVDTDNVIDAFSVPLGDDWYQMIFSFETDLTSQVLWIALHDGTSTTYTGDGDSGCYVAHTEFGTELPGSPIVTLDSTVTRAAEAGLDIPFSNITWPTGASPAVSIHLEGTMSYVDEDIAVQSNLIFWNADADNNLRIYTDTSDTKTRHIEFRHEANALVAIRQPSSIIAYPTGPNSPFNVAGRFGSTVLQGALEGVALDENTAPTALPDLSAANCEIMRDQNSTIKSITILSDDATQAGLELITS